jgi:hypothetical protein
MFEQGKEPFDIVMEHLEDVGENNYMDQIARFCSHGGFPDEDSAPDFSIDDAIVRNERCYAEVTVLFTEKFYGGGCPDMPTRVPCRGRFNMVFDLTTCDIECKPNHDE